MKERKTLEIEVYLPTDLEPLSIVRETVWCEIGAEKEGYLSFAIGIGPSPGSSHGLPSVSLSLQDR